MAPRTWEAETLPDEQADPEDTATPARSSAITAVSALTPGTEKADVLGSRATFAPKTVTPGEISMSERSNQSLWAETRDCEARSSIATRAAAPKPAIAGGFSVPARDRPS